MKKFNIQVWWSPLGHRRMGGDEEYIATEFESKEWGLAVSHVGEGSEDEYVALIPWHSIGWVLITQEEEE